MSTTIDVYPMMGFMPLIEHTRSRTQELFQELLDRHKIGSQIEVRSCYYATSEQTPHGMRWQPEMQLRFAYLLDGSICSSSFPYCLERPRADASDVETFANWHQETGYPPIKLGDVVPLEACEFDGRLTEQELAKVNSQIHFWYEYRSACTHPVACTGYGLVAAALAEATNGVIASFDCAFEQPNGQKPDEFLSWWGDTQMQKYGAKWFRKST
ncbi:hypothetical protein [Propionimicrobium lymphophilum]|uniref:hypothetical protein n=1 Tax=Propionimicrobium lymphophilum TaxID=33012 RepID=UPI00048E0737|nr:hypothetical protein [Propionimicrobium lymphophilum]